MNRENKPLSVLVNATTLVKGGAIQVAASFINEAQLDQESSGIQWCFAVSSQVAGEIDLPQANTKVFEESPAKSKAARSRLREIEQDIEADLVFTIFGPAYVKFGAPHLCGYANGWLTHSGWQAFRTIGNPLRMLRSLLLLVVKGWWLRFADYWVVEAEVARQGLVKRVGLDPDKIAVVPNTCARVFREPACDAAKIPGANEALRLLYLSSFYNHKNISIIPYVAAELKRLQPELKFEFVLTLSEETGEWNGLQQRCESLNVATHVLNVGPVAIAEAPRLYQSCHIAFMPSLLETFSANYPEAMATGRPLVVSDLGFAHDCCGEAASYFDPDSARAAADSILRLVSDHSVWDAQIAAGYIQLAALPDSHDRYLAYLSLLQKLEPRA